MVLPVSPSGSVLPDPPSNDMKKFYQFIRSMRFGMILLGLIGVLCVIATVSGREEIYSSWYFIFLFASLGLNLTLCSVLRVIHLPEQKQALIRLAENSGTTLAMQQPEQWLREHRFHRSGERSCVKNGPGFLGSFLTHASMLLLMVAATCIFSFAHKEDMNLCIGETAELPDGSLLTVEDFRLEDETGKTEYISQLTALLPDGSEAGGTVIVNHPLRLGAYTVYQQNYTYAAVIGVRTGPDEPEEPIKLTEPAFLSLDGQNGIYYSQLFGNVEEDNGEVRISHAQEIVNPAYEVRVAENGTEQTGLVYPGTTLTAGGMLLSFYEPEPAPGLRIKTQPEWALWLLYLSFGLMTLGLYLCFFCVPEVAVIKADGVSLVGRKDISMQIAGYREELKRSAPSVQERN